MNTQDRAYFCPVCFSATVDVSPLAGGDASCTACSWKGRNTELVVHAFKHDFASSEEVVHALAQEFKNLMAANFAAPLAKFLHKWGFFLSPKPTPQELTRYIVAMSRASITAIVEVRREMEKERVRAGN